MTQDEIIEIMAKCSCGTRIAWTRSNDTVEHRGVVDEFYPQNGAEDAYLAVIEPGRYIRHNSDALARAILSVWREFRP